LLKIIFGIENADFKCELTKLWKLKLVIYLMK
jgi:hypothetical protein